VSEEAWYRYCERLGILCGSDEPSDFQKGLAWEEALAWDRAHPHSPGRLEVRLEAPASRGAGLCA
jgi:hypothetical protein